MLILNNKIGAYEKWYGQEIANETETFEKFHYLIQEQLKGIPLTGKRVLEVGCGKGFISLFLAMCSDVKQIVAIDKNNKTIGIELEVL